MSLLSLNVVIVLLFLEKLPCQVVQRRGVKSPFQLQPRFLYQIKGEALILRLHPVGSERFSAVLSAYVGSLSPWALNLLSILSQEEWDGGWSFLLWVCNPPWPAADKHPVSMMLPPSSLTAEIACLCSTADVLRGHKSPFVSHQPSPLILGFSRSSAVWPIGQRVWKEQSLVLCADTAFFFWTVDPIRQTSACGSTSVLFLLFHLESIQFAVNGRRTEDNDGKVPGLFFRSRWPNFRSRRTRSMSSRDMITASAALSLKQDQMCSRSCQMWSKPVFVESLSTRVSRKLQSNKIKVSLSDGAPNRQTANIFRLFDSDEGCPVVHLMWFMTNVCSSRLACIIWCSRMWDRRSSHVTPAPSSPLWTLPRSAFPKQTPHRGEKQRNDASPRCWSWGVLAGGPFGRSLKQSVLAAHGVFDALVLLFWVGCLFLELCNSLFWVAIPEDRLHTLGSFHNISSELTLRSRNLEVDVNFPAFTCHSAAD